ncbi:hypothetical protein EV426DRAFT_705522 [Tirmania nivea]|nr:hypothetical protein EV426DRAFT_705522 [Tirmania nivea]
MLQLKVIVDVQDDDVMVAASGSAGWGGVESSKYLEAVSRDELADAVEYVTCARRRGFPGGTGIPEAVKSRQLDCQCSFKELFNFCWLGSSLANGELVFYQASKESIIEEKEARDIRDERVVNFRVPVSNNSKINNRISTNWSMFREAVNISELSKRTLDAFVLGVAIREPIDLTGHDSTMVWVKRGSPFIETRNMEAPGANTYTIKQEEALSKSYPCASPRYEGDMKFEIVNESGTYLCSTLEGVLKERRTLLKDLGEFGVSDYEHLEDTIDMQGYLRECQRHHGYRKEGLDCRKGIKRMWEWMVTKRYRLTLEWLERMPDSTPDSFKQFALKLVREGFLFRMGRRNMPLKRVARKR